MDPAISADGRFVAYVSSATNLVAGYTLGSANYTANFPPKDVYLFDRLTGTTSLVTRADGSVAKGGDYVSTNVQLSADGRFVAFASQATNIFYGTVPGLNAGLGPQYHIFLYDRVSGDVSLVDHAYYSATTAQGSYSFLGGISADGRYVVYSSPGTLVPGFGQSVYLYDRLTGVNTGVSRSASDPSIGPNGPCDQPRISADGRFVTYASTATNLVAGFVDNNGPSKSDVFVFDVLSGTNALVSHSMGANGGSGGASTAPSINNDGRFIAYLSGATDIVSGFVDQNAAGSDVYLFDRLSGANTLVSRTTSTFGGDRGSRWPVVSADGRFVVFGSLASDLIVGFTDANGPGDAYASIADVGQDLFAYDRLTDNVSLVSHAATSATTGGDLRSDRPQVSANGQVIAYISLATDLSAGVLDRNGGEDVLLYDSATGANTYATARQGDPSWSAGGTSLHQYPVGQVSGDGRFVVYLSNAANLAPGQIDQNGGMDVYVSDRQTKTTQLVSHAFSAPGQAGNNVNAGAIISSDGRYVTFRSLATDLVPGFVDQNGAASPDLYLFDRLSGEITLVSRQAGTASVGGNGFSGDLTAYYAYKPAISGDGRWVAYTSYASDLVAGFVDSGGSNNPDLYLFDRVTGETILVNRSLSGANISSGGVDSPATLNTDGRYVAYSGGGTDMIVGQSGPGGGVKLFDRVTGSTLIVSHVAGSPMAQASGGSDEPMIDDSGRYVTFKSNSTSLVAGQIGGGTNTYQYDRVTSENILVTHRHDSPLTATGATPFAYGVGASSDGRFIAYNSSSSQLVSGFIGSPGDEIIPGTNVFLYDRNTNTTILVSRKLGSINAGGNAGSAGYMVSDDGRFVAFLSYATDLVSNFVDVNSDLYGAGDIYVFDRLLNTTRLVSRSILDGARSGNAKSYYPMISRDGSTVWFDSDASDLAPGDRNGSSDVFFYLQTPPVVQSVKVGDGLQQRSIIKSLTVTFDQAMVFIGNPAAAFTLTRDDSPGQPLSLSATVTTGTTSIVTLTWAGSLTESGSLSDGQYTLSIDAAQVIGFSTLDGNGDGTAGDHYVSVPGTIYRLFGDGNGDRRVDLFDFLAVRSALWSNSGSTNWNPAFDFDGDGVISMDDLLAFRQRLGAAP